jgi:electron transport complex protein RnfB
MLMAILSLTLLGTVLGFGLGVAARKFHVEADPVTAQIEALMPGSNCGQCGFAGCPGLAAAIAEGTAAVTACPPGGKALAMALADKLGISVDLSAVADQGPQIATVAEEICIGCCRCIKVCPTDAILGAAKQIHNDPRSLHRLRQLHRPLPDRGHGDAAGAGNAAALDLAQTRQRLGGLSERTAPWDSSIASSASRVGASTPTTTSALRPTPPCACCPCRSACSCRCNSTWAARRGPSCWSGRRCSKGS